MKPALQERSRATLERLLTAGAELLAEHRFEEATVAELAKRAGSSVGAFYSRFESKEALLEGLDARLFEQARETWRERLNPARNRGRSVEEIVRGVANHVIAARRRHTGLLRNLALYVRSGAPEAYVKRARSLNRFVARGLASLLQEAPRHIDHPHPARAVSWMLLLLDSSTRDVILFGGLGLAPAQSDADLLEALLPPLLACLRGDKANGHG